MPARRALVKHTTRLRQRPRHRMHLTLVGLSHKTAPIEIREKLTFPAHAQASALTALTEGPEVAEAVILSTCNRTEIYAVTASEEGGVDAVLDFACDFHAIERGELARYMYVVQGEAVVRHLFRVVSSLDSMVLGEAQILHQVKEAYDAAFENGKAGRIFNKLFRQSFEVGKRVRTETAIGESAVSISYAAVELAKKVFDTLEGRTILVVGAGKMSELTAKHLVSCGVKKVLVANRTYERAVELAEHFDGEAIPYEDLFTRMREADIVISSTSAPGFVIGRDDVAGAVKGRRAPLFLIDIAVPRDIDPAVNGVGNVFLYDIDDLSGVVESNLEERMREARLAEQIVEQEIGEFEMWLDSMEVVPTIAAIRAGAEAMRQDELGKAIKRLGGLSEKELQTVEALSQAIVNKMLHAPTAVLKASATEKDGYTYVEAARKLYGLDADHEKTHRAHGLRSLLKLGEKSRKDETGEQLAR
jgi:glutamyl-tRNA reductase